MPPQSSRRSQSKSRYTKILKKADTVKVETGTSEDLVDVAKAVLQQVPLSTTGVSTNGSVADREGVCSFMNSMLPGPSLIYDESFFSALLFPVALIYDVAELCGFHSIPPTFLSDLSLSENDTTNKTIMTHIWFALVLGCDAGITYNVIKMYKQSRGSPNIFLRKANMTPRTSAKTGEHNVRNAAVDVTATVDVPRSEELNTRPASPVPRFPSKEETKEARVPPQQEERHQHRFDAEDPRKAGLVNQYFKNRRFTGDIEESIDLIIRDYNVCSQQLKLTQKQKSDYFVNLIDGPPRPFFSYNARDGFSYDQMTAMMRLEFNSDARQLQVQGSLNTLRLDIFMSEKGITSPSDGLTKLVNLIEKLTLQCPPDFRAEGNKIHYLL